jgi:hypothetical protein
MAGEREVGEREGGEREGGEREGGECEEPSTHVIDNADGTRSTTVTKMDGTKVGTVLFYLSLCCTSYTALTILHSPYCTRR